MTMNENFLAALIATIVIVGGLAFIVNSNSPQTTPINEKHFEYNGQPMCDIYFTVLLQDIGASETDIIVEYVYGMDKTLTGKDFWGFPEYSVTLYIGDERKPICYNNINTVYVIGWHKAYNCSR